MSANVNVIRIEGTPLKNTNEQVWRALTRVYGIGVSTSRDMCEKLNYTDEKRVKDLTEQDVKDILGLIKAEGYVLETELRREIAMNVARLKRINSYRGLRHVKGLPCRGQNTRTNAKTRRGRKGSSNVNKKK